MNCVNCGADLGICSPKKRRCAECKRKHHADQQNSYYWSSEERRERAISYASERQKTDGAKAVRHEYNVRLRKERNEAERVRRINNPQKFSNYERQRHYGLTPEQFKSMLDSQNGRCAICGIQAANAIKGRLCVDHNHSTGTVRQLLCGKCNLLLGYCDEKPNVLLRAINYLSQWKRTTYPQALGSTAA